MSGTAATDRSIRSWSRPAFTAVELLVVVASIGVLVALLLPAVQKVREAANRVKCSSNLHNVGLAMHNFYDVNGQFPPAGVKGPFPPVGVTTTARHGWVAFLLPYLEQQATADLYQWEVDSTDPANQPAINVPLPICEPTTHRLLSKGVRPPPYYRSECLREPTAAAGLGVG